jgi:hypothetical protein
MFSSCSENICARWNPLIRPCGESIDVLLAPERLLRRGSRVAARRADDVEGRAATLERILHDLAEELHGHVLERQRRPLREAHERDAAVDVAQGHDAARELVRAVRGVRHGREVIARDVGREQPDDLAGEIGVVEAAPRFESGGIDRRQLRGNREPAVGREAFQQGLAEVGRFHAATGRDVLHCARSSL